MQLLILVLLNIFMAAIFYLVISLKLERSAAEFKQKRLKKEMDELLLECNALAETYITRLENRIKAAKQILAQTGSLQSVDLTIDDTGVKQSQLFDEEASKSAFADANVKTEPLQNNIRTTFKDLFAARAESVISRFKAAAESAFVNKRQSETQNVSIEKTVQILGEAKYASNPSAVSEPAEAVAESSLPALESEEQNFLTEENFAEMFSSAEDKYALAYNLLKNGYSADDIIRFSGLPTGEINLIINLVQEREII